MACTTISLIHTIMGDLLDDCPTTFVNAEFVGEFLKSQIYRETLGSPVFSAMLNALY
jgi:hypothetical protein